MWNTHRQQHCTGLYRSAVSLQTAWVQRRLRCGHSLQPQMVRVRYGQGMPLCWFCSLSVLAKSSLRPVTGHRGHLCSEYLILSTPQRHELHWGNEPFLQAYFSSHEGCVVEVGASSETLKEKARREPGPQSQARGQMSEWRTPTLHFAHPRQCRWSFPRLESS